MFLVAGVTGMKTQTKTLLLSAAFSLILLAQPAEARRFRIFGIPHFGGGESIEQVYDLPDEEPFVKDGDNLDVGYLHGSRKSGFVLYAGDRYRLIGDPEIAMLKGILGFDPTAKYRADHAEENAAAAAEAKAERDHKDELIASGRMIERAAGESSEAYAARSKEFIRKTRSDQAARASKRAQNGQDDSASGSTGSGPASGIIMMLGLIAICVFFTRRKIMDMIFGAAKSVSQNSIAAEDMDQPSTNYKSFDERVARQLAATRSGSEAAQPAMATSPPGPGLPPQALAVRGFGRKLS
jgi:hypothetical protein